MACNHLSFFAFFPHTVIYTLDSLNFSADFGKIFEYIFHDATAPSGPGRPHYRDYTITLTHITLLWTSDEPFVEIST